ncbi:unnamed protein product [Prunus armeniaca]
MELWNMVEDGYEEPENELALTQAQRNALKENRKKDNKALFHIYQTIEMSVYERISHASFAFSALEIDFFGVFLPCGLRLDCLSNKLSQPPSYNTKSNHVKNNRKSKKDKKVWENICLYCYSNALQVVRRGYTM